MTPHRTAEELRHTAHHEAGHAVIARVLTLAAGPATIKPNYREGSAGHAIVHEPYACLHEWEKRGKVREQDAVWHARIMALMAGAEAEAELLGSASDGDGGDRDEIEKMAGELCHASIATSLPPEEARKMLEELRVFFASSAPKPPLTRSEKFGPHASFAPWSRLEPRLRAMTRLLIRRHRSRIERVAKALLAKTTLSARQLDKLIGMSVDDVQVNAPFLLEMHRRRQ